MKQKKVKARSGDELRPEYTRADFPGGFVRGKYAGFVSPGVRDAWLDEAERRSLEIDSGKVKCVPAEEVFEKAKALLKKKRR